MRAVRGAIAFVAVIALTGCFFAERGANSDNVAIRMPGDDFEIVLCDELDVTFVRMEYRQPGDAWVEFWTYEGAAVAVEGEAILSTRASSPFPSASTPPTLRAGTDVVVQLHAGSARQDSYFTVPDEGLSDERWLLVDDSEVENPCPPKDHPSASSRSPVTGLVVQAARTP